MYSFSVFLVVFFKQKTAYEMRISDWSSDVCSSDLIGVIIAGVYVIEAGHLTMGGLIACSILSSRVLNSTSQITRLLLQWHHARHSQIRRASCRERVCQYV